MGFKVNSNFGTANWLDTYATDFRLYQGFSVCTATVDNKRDGVLALGVDYTNDPRFKIAFPGIGGTQWNVYLKDFLVAGRSLGLPTSVLDKRAVWIDFGTTLTIVPPIVMKALQLSFTNLCKSGNNLVGVCNQPPGTTLFDGKCFPMTDKQIAEFPVLSLDVGGWGSVPFDSSAYLWEGIPGQKCLGIHNSGSDSHGSITIGAVFLQKYHLFFDRRTMNIGLADKSTCPKPTSKF
jgi:hypothetical protein